MMRHLVIATAFSLLTFSAAAAEPLSGPDLRRIMNGTWHLHVAGAVNMTVNISPGGGISGTTDKGDHDTGRWSISGNQVCIKFKRWLDGAQKCESVTLDRGVILSKNFTGRR